VEVTTRGSGGGASSRRRHMGFRERTRYATDIMSAISRFCLCSRSWKPWFYV